MGFFSRLFPRQSDISLLLASRLGYMKDVKSSLREGASIDATDQNDSTALMLACGMGRTEIVKYLIEYGADINKKDRYNCSALVYAILGGGDIETVVSHIDLIIPESGEIIKRAPEIIKLLVKEGANLENIDDFGCTPLIWAIRRNEPKYLVIPLLNSGADPLNPGKSQVPLKWAVEKGNSKVISILKERIEDVESELDEESVQLCEKTIPITIDIWLESTQVLYELIEGHFSDRITIPDNKMLDLVEECFCFVGNLIDRHLLISHGSAVRAYVLNITTALAVYRSDLEFGLDSVALIRLLKERSERWGQYGDYLDQEGRDVGVLEAFSTHIYRIVIGKISLEYVDLTKQLAKFAYLLSADFFHRHMKSENLTGE